MVKESKNLPWVEKYRPSNLDDLISHKDIVSTIHRFIEEDRMPHLMLYGPPGTGKTSTILACANRIYKRNQIASMVLELNASDDRGIGVVREKILAFASTQSLFSGRYKLIILDEADAMTRDAQNALRRIIEKYTKWVRFCIICNYLSKMIPAIQSRCTRFRFAPLAPAQMSSRLLYVSAAENVNMTDDGKEALLRLAQGDMRRVLNVLQSTAMAFDLVNEQNVYACVGHPLRADITNIITWLLNENFSDTYSRVKELKLLKGLALQDILADLHPLVHRLDVPSTVHVTLLEKMADIECRLCAGASEKLQLAALIAAFLFARQFAAVQGPT